MTNPSISLIGQQIRKKIGVSSTQDFRLFEYTMKNRDPGDTPMRSVKKALSPFSFKDFSLMSEDQKKELIDKLEKSASINSAVSGELQRNNHLLDNTQWQSFNDSWDGFLSTHNQE